MSVSVDAARSPALAAQTSLTMAVTTASFTPLDSTLLVACPFQSQNATNYGFTITNNGTALTWVPIILRNSADTGAYQSGAAGFYAVLSTGRALTVTCTSTYYYPTMKVYSVMGADLGNPVGGSVKTGSVSNSFATTAFNNVRASSMGFVVAAGTTANAVTSNDTTYSAGPNSNGHYGLAGYKALGAAGAASTFHLETAGSAGKNVVSFEIMAALDRTGDFLPFFGMGHHDEAHDELAARRTVRRSSGLYVPRPRELTVARAA